MRPLKVIGACAAGATALAYAAYRKDLKAARERIETKGQIIDSPHGPIEFAEAGDGTAVLLIHGAGGGFDQGLGLGAAFLGDGYRIVAPSRFGYLGTPLPAYASPEAQADAHLRLLDALQLDSVPVIGVSAGGPSAMQLALRYPERCSALVLVVPMAWAAQRAAGDTRLSPLFLPLLNAVASSDFLFWTAIKIARPAMVKTILGTPVEVYRNATTEERRSVDRMLRTILPISKRVAGTWNDSDVASNLTRYPLEEMRIPTLVISAADDLYDTYESGIHTAEQIRDARFTGFSTGGHLLLGHEAEVRSEITTFLRKHLGSRTAVAV
ncbi:MAG TPA: alpha/beta hydrolase [Thermoanaerobaculia bacterium]|jgi:pimeloyl-ACP methyl ester carboxylesterase|nr:alpha/beta hydrolase [Thermoanaerobaculia bacterium]